MIASQVLYYFESNTRSATIIGIVGAGGIGLHLAEQIRMLEWQKVSFLILMILVTVAVIDWISGRLRFAIIGQRAVASDPTAQLSLNAGIRPARPRSATRVVSSGLPSSIDIDAVDDEHGRRQRQIAAARRRRRRRSPR